MSEDTLFHAFSPFFLVCLVMGTVTFRLRTHDVTTSFAYNLLPLLYLCANGYSFYLAVCDRFFSDKFETKNSIETTTDCFQILGAFLAQSSAWVESIFAKRNFMEAMRRLYDFDDVIQKRFKYDFRYSHWRNMVIGQLMSGFVFYFCLINFILYAYMARFGSDSIPVWITYSLPMGTSGLRYFQFINMAYVIKLRFRIINDELRIIRESCRDQKGILSEEKHGDLKTISNVFKKNNFSTIGHGEQLFVKKNNNFKNNMIYNVSDDIKVIDVNNRLDENTDVPYYPSNFETYKPALPSQYKAQILNSNSLIDRLAVLCELHDELCDICGLVDKSFGYSMLANIAVAFISTTGQLYLVFTILTTDFTNDLYTTASGLWILPAALPLTILCAVCHSTVTEAKKTGPLLHKIQSEATDERYKDFVDLFSLQLMHQTVKFSPCGFFDVDFTLLFAMTGAITTYLVILIQFHLSSNTSKTNSTAITEMPKH